MQILDQILAVFGQKILILMGVRKSFGTYITENHLDNLFALFFGQSLDQMGQKCQYLAENASFGPKSDFLGLISPLDYLGKGTFFFEQLFPVVARTWLGYRSECLFLGPKFRFLVQKSDFCHTTPILVDDPFLALGMTVNFPPWEQFFDFPFRSYSCFRKKILLTAQKVFPLPTVGFYCTVKALALSACRRRARALRAWA